MSERPFHHGNLRADLLARARATLRDAGEPGVSLRSLAREAGVSHGAPRRHFAERQDLLDALAAQGFDDLTTQVHRAATRHEADPVAALREFARIYVEFATDEAALLRLMFAVKVSSAADEVNAAAERYYAAAGPLVAAAAPAASLPVRDQSHVLLLFISVIDGVAGLVMAGRLEPGLVETLLDGAVALFVTPRR